MAEEHVKAQSELSLCVCKHHGSILVATGTPGEKEGARKSMMRSSGRGNVKTAARMGQWLEPYPGLWEA